MKQSHPKKSNQGFTLVELMIAMVVGIIVLTGVFIIFKNQQTSYTTQDQLNMAQQNLRAAMEMIKHDIQIAGFVTNWDPQEFRADWDNADGDNDITTDTEKVRPVILSTDSNIQSDAITVFKADPTTRHVLDFSEKAKNNSLQLDNYTDLGLDVVQAFGVLVTSDISTSAELFMVTNPGDPATIVTRSIIGANNLIHTYSSDDMVFAADIVTYSVDGNNNLLRNNQVMAENIENIQFQYLDRDYNVANDVDEFTNGASDVRAIDIFMLIRTDSPEPDYVDRHTYQIGNAVLNPNDNFRRKVLKSRIRTRNIGLAII